MTQHLKISKLSNLWIQLSRYLYRYPQPRNIKKQSIPDTSDWVMCRSVVSSFCQNSNCYSTIIMEIFQCIQLLGICTACRTPFSIMPGHMACAFFSFWYSQWERWINSLIFVVSCSKPKLTASNPRFCLSKVIITHCAPLSVIVDL